MGEGARGDWSQRPPRDSLKVHPKLVFWYYATAASSESNFLQGPLKTLQCRPLHAGNRSNYRERSWQNPKHSKNQITGSTRDKNQETLVTSKPVKALQWFPSILPLHLWCADRLSREKCWDTNSIPTNNNLVAKFVTTANAAIWWPNLQLMKVGQIWN